MLTIRRVRKTSQNVQKGVLFYQWLFTHFSISFCFVLWSDCVCAVVPLPVDDRKIHATLQSKGNHFHSCLIFSQGQQK